MSLHSKKPTKKQLIKTIKELQENPNDRVRILGEVGVTILGAGAAGSVVAAIGVPTAIPIITAVTGYVVIGATPIGWVAGAAIGGGAAAYGLSQFIKNGAEKEGQKKELLKNLQEELKKVGRREKSSSISTQDKNKFYTFLEFPLKMNWLSPEIAQEIISSVENGHMPLSRAYKLVEDIIREEGNSSNTSRLSPA